MSVVSRGFLLSGRDNLPESERDILLTRQALHAESIEFDHPSSGERLTISAPLPEDICGVVDALRAETE
jgi:23S rRNA pseudouridine1911/1915/1917 synthase